MCGVRSVCFILLLLACEREPPRPAATPREALRQWARCTFEDARGQPTAAEFEASVRRALRRDRERFVARAGRCEDALIVGESVPPCIARLKERWDAMLPIAQRPVDDAIDLDVAVRRVGEAWTDANARCP